jgi:hypothetical protein
VHPGGNYGSKDITLSLNLAVSDIDAFLYRVGFNVILAGVFRPLAPADPCQTEIDKLKKLEFDCHSGYQNQIDAKKAILETVDRREYARIKGEIDVLTEKLGRCPIDLTAARNALNLCKIAYSIKEDNPLVENL